MPKARVTQQPVLDQLERGHVPLDENDLERLTAGRGLWLDFFMKFYMQDFVHLGISKVKFLIGKEGVGKTHYLKFLSSQAPRYNCLTVYIDAKTIRLQKIDGLYREIVSRVDLPALVRMYCKNVVQELAGKQLVYDTADIGSLRQALATHLGSIAIADRKLHQKLIELYKNANLHRYFSLAIMHLAQQVIGLKPLTDSEQTALYSWLGGNSVPVTVLRPLQIFAKPDRYNGRAMLRSLFEFIRLIGHSGILVFIDSVEVLLETNLATRRPLYTRLARDDAYEMIRQLVDETESYNGVVFLLAARPELFTDTERGVRSYYALWLRVQDEIILKRFNKLADRVNLDSVLDPPSPNSAEDKLLRAVFGEKGIVDDVSLTELETEAIQYLQEISTRVASILGARKLSRKNLVVLLRTKNFISPVKKTVLKTLETS